VLLFRDHLKRRHKLPVQCERCWEPQANQDDLISHRRAPESCPLVAENPEEGMSITQVSAVDASKRFSSAQSEREKWYIIWAILFPGEEPPVSPCKPTANQSVYRLYLLIIIVQIMSTPSSSAILPALAISLTFKPSSGERQTDFSDRGLTEESNRAWEEYTKMSVRIC
jgi:hypothetical protein